MGSLRTRPPPPRVSVRGGWRAAACAWRSATATLTHPPALLLPGPAAAVYAAPPPSSGGGGVGVGTAVVAGMAGAAVVNAVTPHHHMHVRHKGVFKGPKRGPMGRRRW